jgi:hypothetical protein
VLATLAAFEVRYDLPVVFAETPQEAATIVERWVWYFSRQVVEDANDLLRGCEMELSQALPESLCQSQK